MCAPRSPAPRHWRPVQTASPGTPLCLRTPPQPSRGRDRGQARLRPRPECFPGPSELVPGAAGGHGDHGGGVAVPQEPLRLCHPARRLRWQHLPVSALQTPACWARPPTRPLQRRTGAWNSTFKPGPGGRPATAPGPTPPTNKPHHNPPDALAGHQTRKGPPRGLARRRARSSRRARPWRLWVRSAQPYGSLNKLDTCGKRPPRVPAGANEDRRRRPRGPAGHLHIPDCTEFL